MITEGIPAMDKAMLGGPCREKAQTQVEGAARHHKLMAHGLQVLAEKIKDLEGEDEAAVYEVLQRLRFWELAR